MIAEYKDNFQKIILTQIPNNVVYNDIIRMCTSSDFCVHTRREKQHKLYKRLSSTSLAIPSGFYKDLDNKYKGIIKWLNANEFINSKYIDMDKFKAFLDDPSFSNFVPHKHQKEAAYKSILYRKTRSYIDVSGGKTFICYMIAKYSLQHILDSGECILLVVPKPTLVSQFIDELELFQNSNIEDKYKVIAQPIYDGMRFDKNIEDFDKKELKRYVPNANIVVGSRKTLALYNKEYFNKFSVVIFDECHTVRVNDTVKRGVKQFGEAERIYFNLNMANVKVLSGMTGTMPEEGDAIRNKNKKPKLDKFGNKLEHLKSFETLTLVSLFGPIVVSKTLNELISDGKSSDFEIIQIVIEIDDHEFAEKFYNDPDIIDQQKRRYREMELIFNTGYQERIVSQILSKPENKDKNSMFLFNTLPYLRSFNEFLCNDPNICNEYKNHIITGSVKNTDRDIIKQEFSDSGGNNVLATYATMDTGTSIKRLHNYFLVDSCKEFYRVRQSIGRTVRLHDTKDKAIIYDFVYKISNPIQDIGMRNNIMYKQGMYRRKIYEHNGYKLKVVNVKSSQL